MADSMHVSDTKDEYWQIPGFEELMTDLTSIAIKSYDSQDLPATQSFPSVIRALVMRLKKSPELVNDVDDYISEHVETASEHLGIDEFAFVGALLALRPEGITADVFMDRTEALYRQGDAIDWNWIRDVFSSVSDQDMARRYTYGEYERQHVPFCATFYKELCAVRGT